MNIKFGPQIESGSAHRPILFGVDDVIDDVPMCKEHRKFKTAVCHSIF